tara:strand:+ start:107 stop:1384 length:1278 start_codon:yes stop_codon:yes gene_type:complete
MSDEFTSDIFEIKAAILDANDPLRGFRDRFLIDDEKLIYLDGNSLGRLPRIVNDLIHQIVNEQWGGDLVRSWNKGWLEVSSRIGDKIGDLIGSSPGEVILADSTTVCLYKAAVAALRSKPECTVILTDDENFPSDIQALRAATASVGSDHELVVVPISDGIHGSIDALANALNDKVALVALSHVSYKSGWCWDLEAVTSAVHSAGALMLWDLSHSVGVVPIDLGAAAVDLAVGCTYKYLNGGPGSPAFLYVPHGRTELINPIAGWFGSNDPFDFDPETRPALGVTGFLTGTPPIISGSLIEPGVDLVLEAGIDVIWSKSKSLTERFISLVDHRLTRFGFKVNTPRNPNCRGSHISLSHPNALAVSQALIQEQSTIPDFRPPDMLRFGFSPLYTTFSEIDESISRIETVMSEELFKKWENAKPVVP